MRTAPTATELTILREKDQTARLYLAVHRPATIFSARINQTTFTYPLATLTFDGGSGSNVKAGMTLFVGSSAGASDKGKVRVRADLTSAATGTLSVAEFGQYAINLADNDYLTVMEDYRIGARFPRWNGSAWVLDYDVAYSDQNTNYGPLAVIGPAACGFLESSVCKLKYVGERSAAYTPSRSISTYAWTFPDGQTSSSQGTTASPVTITYSAAIPGGKYHALTVTESVTGKTHVGRRLTFVFDRTGSNAPFDAVLLSTISGGPEQGGYRTAIRVLNTAATTTDFPDGAHIVVFKESHYGDYWYVESVTGTFTVGETVTGGTSAATGTLDEKTSSTLYKISGPMSQGLHSGEVITGASSGATARIYTPEIGGNFPHRSNVLFEGWIVSETIRKNPATGEIEFEAETVNGEMRRALSYPVALTSYNVTPIDSWERLGPGQTMTVNLAALHFALWRSTVAAVVDFYLATGAGGTVLKYCDMDATNLWDQIRVWYERAILGWVASDMQSSLYCEANCQIDETTRSATITAWDIAAGDRRGTLEIQRQVIDRNAQVTLYGVAWKTPLGSRSPDDPHYYEGDTEEITEGLAVSNQSTLNTWCGNLRAMRNSKYPQVAYALAGQWPADAVPQSFARETLGASDTLRGFVWSNQKLVIRETNVRYDPRSQRLLSEMTCEIETTGLGGATVVFPVPSDPEPIPAPAPPLTPFQPPLSSEASELWFLDSADQIVWSEDIFDDLSVAGGNTWHSLDLPTDCESAWGFGGSNVGSFVAVADGSAVYVSGRIANEPSTSKRWAIWQCANPKGQSPSWTQILKGGDTMNSNTVYTDVGNSTPFSRMVRYGNKLLVLIRPTTGSKTFYGEYSGSAWTFYDFTSTATLATDEAPWYRVSTCRSISDPNGLRNVTTDADITTYVDDIFGVRPGMLWTSQMGSNRYVIRQKSSVAYVRDLTASSDVLTGLSRNNAVGQPTMLRGCLRATKIITVDGNGVLYYSSNGTSFNAQSQATATGTVAINGTTTVTGTGTAFLSEVAVSDVIVVNGETRVVATVPSNTSLTVTSAFSTTASGQTMTINPAWKHGIGDFLDLDGGLQAVWIVYSTSASGEIIRVNADVTVSGITNWKNKTGDAWTSGILSGTFNCRDAWPVFEAVS